MQTMAVFVAVVVVVLAGVSADTPKCDSSMDNYKQNNLLSTMEDNGEIYYSLVSTDSATIEGQLANCITIKIAGQNAKVTYKFPNADPITKTFTVKETDGALEYDDGDQASKIVMVMAENGVYMTLRCCDSCSGSGPDVGIAVASGMLSDAKTQSSIDSARSKMSDMGLDKDVVELNGCQH